MAGCRAVRVDALTTLAKEAGGRENCRVTGVHAARGQERGSGVSTATLADPENNGAPSPTPDSGSYSTEHVQDGSGLYQQGLLTSGIRKARLGTVPGVSGSPWIFFVCFAAS